MHLQQFRGFTAFAIAGCTALSCFAAAGQTAPDRAVLEALNRIGADLFSAMPHPAEAIDELRAILAAQPALAEGQHAPGHRLSGAGLP